LLSRRLQDITSEVRLSFIHNPATSNAPASHAYSFSNVIPALIDTSELPEVYPNELLAYLEFNASPENPPKRSLSDEWTQDNPLTPFVNGGATEAQQATATNFWGNAETFVKNAGLASGASAVVVNGRVRLLAFLLLPCANLFLRSTSSSSSSPTSLLLVASTLSTSTSSSAVSVPWLPPLSSTLLPKSRRTGSSTQSLLSARR
jgi:hypothetical protein